MPFLIDHQQRRYLDLSMVRQIEKWIDLDSHLERRILEEGIAGGRMIRTVDGGSAGPQALGIVVAQGDEHVDGGILLLGAAPEEASQAEESVLAGTSYALSQLAVRMDQWSKLEKANELLTSHAYMDPLTDIPNRRMLVEHLNRALAQAERTQIPVHVAFIDLDGFKVINDEHGHDAGDELLVQISRRLLAGIRTEDVVARYGGDEFVCVLPADGREPLEVQRSQIAERLLRLSSSLFNLNGIDLDYPGPSIGVVTSQAQDLDADALIRQADEAMYATKRLRRVKQA